MVNANVDALPIDKWVTGKPWERAAASALDRGHYRLIPMRRSSELYFARFWLQTPNGTRDSGYLESGDSMLLHWLVQPDDDDALHDHPWDFESRILSGGYVEEISDGYGKAQAPDEQNREPDLGPTKTWFWNHDEGEIITKKATDLHRIRVLHPNTWTLVITGPRVREWGFHPAGKPWQDWRSYLGIEKTVPGD